MTFTLAGRALRPFDLGTLTLGQVQSLLRLMRRSGLHQVQLPDGSVDSAALAILDHMVRAGVADDVFACFFLPAEAPCWSLETESDVRHVLRDLSLPDQAVVFGQLAVLSHGLATGDWPKLRALAGGPT
ncbi:MAG: hypothetical protein ACREL3_07500 [Gemmatimonadales bacterium]